MSKTKMTHLDHQLLHNIDTLIPKLLWEGVLNTNGILSFFLRVLKCSWKNMWMSNKWFMIHNFVLLELHNGKMKLIQSLYRIRGGMSCNIVRPKVPTNTIYDFWCIRSMNWQGICLTLRRSILYDMNFVAWRTYLFLSWASSTKTWQHLIYVRIPATHLILWILEF